MTMELKLTLICGVKEGADVDKALLQQDIIDILAKGFTNPGYRLSQIVSINGAISYYE